CPHPASHSTKGYGHPQRPPPKHGKPKAAPARPTSKVVGHHSTLLATAWPMRVPAPCPLADTPPPLPNWQPRRPAGQEHGPPFLHSAQAKANKAPDADAPYPRLSSRRFEPEPLPRSKTTL